MPNEFPKTFIIYLHYVIVSTRKMT